MKPAISVRNVSKEFRLGELSGTDTLRDAMTGWFRHRSRRNGSQKTEDNYVRALRDVSFDVDPGEVLGIIGHNGAGKSTLLKILSRITEPTNGKIEIRGRVSSLLEVGTGFHPELTGRENIILNGSILGMKRAEIAAKFDEIVDFSGVERFLDTPVKRYSTGMQVRLAFAVAAHLEPEILIIDEVLAVGDAEFQRKCLGKMDDVANSGRTVLFVSHNMAAIRTLCSRAILLNRGALSYDGLCNNTVDIYLSKAQHFSLSRRRQFPECTSKAIKLREIFLDKTISEDMAHIEICTPIHFSCEADISEFIKNLQICMKIYDSNGNELIESFANDFHSKFRNLKPGKFKFQVAFPPRILPPGQYTVHLTFGRLSLDQYERLDAETPAIDFRVEDTVTPRGINRKGVLGPVADWRAI